MLRLCHLNSKFKFQIQCRRNPKYCHIQRHSLNNLQTCTKAISGQYIISPVYKCHQNVSPPSVVNSCTRWAWYLERTLMNLLKSATLLRVRKSISLSLRSRGCTMLTMCSLCGQVIHPTLASSVTNAWLGSMRSSSWTPLTDSQSELRLKDGLHWTQVQ